MIQPIYWKGNVKDGVLMLLEQRLLPKEEKWLEFHSCTKVADAIQTMIVRGAPAIGVAAAFAMVLAVRESQGLDFESRKNFLKKAREQLAATRPTAVNLFWALENTWQHVLENIQSPNLVESLWKVAVRIHEEDVDACKKIGAYGAAFIADNSNVLTHCNAGGLATGGYGTALGVIIAAHSSGKRIHVYVDETRPRFQGAKLTAWELHRLQIPFTLICDNMAAMLMAQGKIQACVTGADRIASNGDSANKIGTYSVAVNAHYHKIPFYIAAPRSTFDMKIPDGSHIPIEERHQSEITDPEMQRICPEGIKAYNPGFDVTPAKLIAGIFTEKGVVQPVTKDGIARIFSEMPS